jgi:hypothetical protein
MAELTLAGPVPRKTPRDDGTIFAKRACHDRRSWPDSGEGLHNRDAFSLLYLCWR